MRLGSTKQPGKRTGEWIYDPYDHHTNRRVWPDAPLVPVYSMNNAEFDEYFSMTMNDYYM